MSTVEKEKLEEERKQSKQVLTELKSVLLVKQKEFEVRGGDYCWLLASHLDPDPHRSEL